MNSQKLEIKDKIQEIALSLIDIENEAEGQDERSVLHIILSHSQLAINFICLLEEEFDIEIGDEFINIDFFLSFKTISKVITYYIE